MSPSQGIRLTTLPEGHTLLRAATAAIGADYCDFCAEWRTHYRAHWLTRFDLLWTAPERSNAVEVCVLLDDEGHPVAGMHVEHGSEGLRDDPVWFANVWTRPFNRGGGCAATLVSAVVNGLPAKGTRIGLCADPPAGPYNLYTRVGFRAASPATHVMVFGDSFTLPTAVEEAILSPWDVGFVAARLSGRHWRWQDSRRRLSLEPDPEELFAFLLHETGSAGRVVTVGGEQGPEALLWEYSLNGAHHVHLLSGDDRGARVRLGLLDEYVRKVVG